MPNKNRNWAADQDKIEEVEAVLDGFTIAEEYLKKHYPNEDRSDSFKLQIETMLELRKIRKLLEREEQRKLEE
jgi:hypothetical protein